jgi:Carboxypeptidase regulatory-like domain
MHWTRSRCGADDCADGAKRRAVRPRKDPRRWALAVLIGSVVLLVVGPIAGAQAAGTASLSGAVTAIKGGGALEGIEVTASGSNGFGTTTTAAGGKYTIAGGQLGGGTYNVSFSDPTGDHVPQVKQATLTEGEPGELNAALQETGSISGTVTSAANGAGLGNVFVSITGPVSEFTSTEANGHYTIGELPPGTYSIEFTANGGEFIGQTQQTTVTEGIASQVNAALKQGGKISGRVTDAYTHNGLGKIFVEAFSSSGSGEATTNDNGEYTVTGLPSGSYKVEYSWEFSEGEDKEFEKAPRFIPKYLTQFFNGQPSAATANTVGASEGNVTSGIDVAMVPSAPVNTALPAISGTPTVGSQLSCSNGSWTGESQIKLSLGWPLTTPFSYQWLRSGTAITGSTSPAYVVQAADVGHSLECEVTAANEAGHASAKSKAFAVANPVPVLTTAVSKLLVSKNATKVSIKCANATCAGSGQLVQTVVVKHRKGKKTVRRKTTLVVATGTYSLAAGKTGAITLRLTSAGKKRLAGAHRLSPKLLISVTGGKRLEKTVQLSMPATKKRKKK